MIGNSPWSQVSPSGWQQVPAKSLFGERREACRTGDPHLTPSQKYGVLPQSEYMERTGSKVVLNLVGQDNMKHVEPDDFIIHLRSFQGGLEHSRLSGKVSSAYTVLRPRSVVVHTAYYRWLFKSYGYISALAGLTNQLRDGQSIKFGDFAQIDLPLPPLDEQQRIADFLDDQVALLDRAIDLRQQQIELGLERFNSVLWGHFALHSGSPTIPLKRVAHYVEGPGIGAADFRDEGVPVIRLAGVKDTTVTLDGCNYVEPETAAKRWNHLAVKPGELLVSGSAGIRFPVVVPPEVAGAIPYTGLIRVWPSREDVSRSLLRYFLGSPSFTSQVDQLKTGVGVQHWGPSHLGQIHLPTSCLGQQEHVLSEIAEVEDNMRLLQSQLDRSVRLLAERKQALITAAVTGQFDVTTARSVA